MRGKAWRGSDLSFGDFGLKVMEPGWVTDRQIEAARVAMTRFVKRGGKIWIRLFPDKPVTKKPAETRMGKGKGAPDHWVAVVRPGKILFEMDAAALAPAPRKELQHQERDLNDQLFKLKFQMKMGQNESLKKILGMRKDIARVKTIKREKQIAAAKTGTEKK